MHRIKSGRPSPAFVLAAIALFVSLGGTGYAASQMTARKSKPLTKAQVNKQIATYFNAHRSELQGATGPAGKAGANGKAGSDGKDGKDGAKGETGATGPGAIKFLLTGSSAVNGAQPLATVGPWTLTQTCAPGAPNATVTIKGPGNFARTTTTTGSIAQASGAIGAGVNITVNTGGTVSTIGFLESNATVYELKFQLSAENGGLFESCPVIGDAILAQ
jgi:hypothetical protein